MQSKLLLKNGLNHIIGGSNYNFRSNHIGEAQMEKEIHRLSSELGVRPSVYYLGQQVHGHHVQDISSGQPGEFAGGCLFEETDGLMTDRPGVALIIKFADCTPIVFYDPIQKVQACVHSGWRSTVQRISAVAVQKMEKEFGSRTENILAYIGPSIAREDYEVGAEVYQAFEEFDYRDEIFDQKENGKYQLDMTLANNLLLKEIGLLEENIDVSKRRTFHDPELHSARAEGKDYGLNAIMTVISKGI